MTQPDGEGSDQPDTGPADVDRRPDTAGYPTADDAGAPVAEEPIPTDDRDRAGYPDAKDASEPN